MSSRPRCSTARATCRVATLFASCLGVAFGLSAQVASGAPGDTELISIDAGTGLPNGGTLTLQRSDMDRLMSADGRYVVFHRDGRYWRRDRQAGTAVIVAAAPNVSSLVYSPSITPDGRYVAFSSAATGLVTGDTNAHIDAFVRDMSTGTIERVSVSTSGTQSNGDSRGVSISADGRYVAFASVASNLTAGDTNGFDDVFLRDRQLGTTTRLQSSLINTTPSLRPSITADAHDIAFSDKAHDGSQQALVFDRTLGHIVLETDDSDEPWISADGNHVAMKSNFRLEPGEPKPDHTSIYMVERPGPDIRSVLASASSSGERGNASSWSPSVSDDGRFVAFVSSADNLVPEDTNGKDDVFVRDVQRGLTWRASIGSDGQQANGASLNAAISSDGRFVVFSSLASNLAAGDTNGTSDVFVHENPALTGPQSFALDPVVLDFAPQTLNTIAQEASTVWVRNTGATALSITDIQIGGTNATDFLLDPSRCGQWVAVGDGCPLDISFLPRAMGTRTADLVVVAGEAERKTTTLTGTGVAGKFTLLPRSIDFGAVPVGTTSAPRTVTVTNTGVSVLPSITVSRWGVNKNQFVVSTDCPPYVYVQPGGTCTVTVRFKPTQAGAKLGYVKVTAQGGANAKSSALHGTGT